MNRATGTAALSVDAAKADSRGVVDVPSYLSIVAINTGPVTVAATGSHPTVSGTGTPASGTVTSAGVGTHTAPVHSATAAPNIGSVTASASGNHSLHGTAALTVGPATIATPGLGAEFLALRLGVLADVAAEPSVKGEVTAG